MKTFFSGPGPKSWPDDGQIHLTPPHLKLGR